MVGYDPLVDDPSVFPAYVPVPEEGGAHVVCLDDKTLLMAASAPRTAELYSGMGYDLEVVDIDQFEKVRAEPRVAFSRLYNRSSDATLLSPPLPCDPLRSSQLEGCVTCLSVRRR